MYLSELIERLEQEDPDLILSPGWHNPHSWRGSYSELAFEPKESATVAECLAAAREADGSTYQGWKGGDYTMHGYSEVYLAELVTRPPAPDLNADEGETVARFEAAPVLEEAWRGGEMRVSPDGLNVAVRNRDDRWNPWRVTNGGYYADAHVADWLPLTIADGTS